MFNPVEAAAITEEALPLGARLGAKLLADSGLMSDVEAVAARMVRATEGLGLRPMLTREQFLAPKFSPRGPFTFDETALPADRNSPQFQALVSKQLGIDPQKLDAGNVAVLHRRFTQQALDLTAAQGKRDLGLWGSTDQGHGLVEYKTLPSTRGYLSSTDSVVRITKTLDSAAPIGQADRASSGVFVKSNGTIATNEHVVRNANSITVETQDGRTFPAQVVSADAANDLAILKLSGVPSGNKFPVPEFADLETLFKDARVAAVGHHGGLKGLIASPGQYTGLVNWGKGQYAIDGLFKGASGSPIFNNKGQLAGLVAKLRPDIPKLVTGPTSDLIRQKLYGLIT